MSLPCKEQNQDLGSVLCFLLAAMQRQAPSGPHAALQQHQQPPEYPGVAPTGFRGLMQPFFSWKDDNLYRSKEAKGRREVPFNSLAQYPGKLQLQNCILGALRATSPCGEEFQRNFCRGFKLQVEKKKKKSLWGAQFKASDQEVLCSRDPQVSLGQHLLVWLITKVAPLTEHSIREKRKKEKGEKLNQNSLNALWCPSEYTGSLGHPTTICKGNKEKTCDIWN